MSAGEIQSLYTCMYSMRTTYNVHVHVHVYTCTLLVHSMLCTYMYMYMHMYISVEGNLYNIYFLGAILSAGKIHVQCTCTCELVYNIINVDVHACTCIYKVII